MTKEQALEMVSEDPLVCRFCGGAFSPTRLCEYGPVGPYNGAD
jgi:hypothetical protein